VQRKFLQYFSHYLLNAPRISSYILARQRLTPGASAEHGLAVPTYPCFTAVPSGQTNGSVCSQRPAMHQWNAHLLTVSATNRLVVATASEPTSLLRSIHATVIMLKMRHKVSPHTTSKTTLTSVKRKQRPYTANIDIINALIPAYNRAAGVCKHCKSIRNVIIFTQLTISLAVAKRPCDCCVDQFWPNIHCVPKKWRQNSNHYNYGTPYQN